MGRNVMCGQSLLGLSRQSFRCRCTSQMDLFDNCCKYLNLSISRESSKWLKEDCFFTVFYQSPDDVGQNKNYDPCHIDETLKTLGEISFGHGIWKEL